MLDQKKLMEMLAYNPATGMFYWVAPLSAAHSVKKGDRAGTVNKEGYVHIKIDGKSYLGHRLAWLYITGSWPKGILGHRDGDRANNAWLNLREATRSQNSANSKLYKNNTNGVKGVFRQKNGKFTARIRVNGKLKSLGTCDDIGDAAAAYKSAADENFGKFARA